MSELVLKNRQRGTRRTVPPSMPRMTPTPTPTRTRSDHFIDEMVESVMTDAHALPPIEYTAALSIPHARKLLWAKVRKQALFESEKPLDYRYNQNYKFLYLLNKNKNNCSIDTEDSWIRNIVNGSRLESLNYLFRFNAIQRRMGLCPYVVVPLGIHNVGGGGHQVLLFIDRRKKTVRFFDPNGSMSYIYGSPGFPEALRAYFYSKGYTLEFERCLYGIQAMQGSEYLDFKGDPGGFCMAWSFLVAELKVRFPQLEMDEIQQTIQDAVPNLTKFIRGEANFTNRIVLQVGENVWKLKNMTWGHQSRIYDYFVESNAFDELKMWVE